MFEGKTFPCSRPIQTYFDANARDDGDALAHVFATDAVVLDEGEIHRGPAAIRGWWRKTKDAYGVTVEPLDLTDANGHLVVRARVTGSFPGSPAVLTFTFGLAHDRIAELEIH